MVYQEKKGIVSIISSIAIVVIYGTQVLGQAETAENIFSFWGASILTLIGITIVAKIIITIVFNIIYRITEQEEEPDFMDERDKMIELKASRNALYLFSLGFIGAMVTQVIGMSPSVMFISLVLGGLVSDIVSDISMIYFYRRGY